MIPQSKVKGNKSQVFSADDTEKQVQVQNSSVQLIEVTFLIFNDGSVKWNDRVWSNKKRLMLTQIKAFS